MGMLDGKSTIVTGASSGIGWAAALMLAEEGARIVLNARRPEPLEALRDRIVAAGGDAVAVAGDVGEEQVARRLVEVAEDQFDGLDLAFNNAGIIGPMVGVTETTSDDWDAVIRTNLTSAYHCAKYQVPAMLARGAGSIVFTASFVGHTVGFPGMGAYAASKAGVIGLAKNLAVEHASSGVRVNALLPGGTDTPMGGHNQPGAGPEVRAFIEGIHALKRIAEPDEIARAALFLLSDAASFVTGTAMLVDGGVSVTRT